MTGQGGESVKISEKGDRVLTKGDRLLTKGGW
jgi:hypothetical protein